MTMKISTARVFSALSDQIDRSRTWLRARIKDACHYKAETLLDCLTQRIVEFSLAPYNRAVHARLQANPADFPPSGMKVDCRTLVLHTGSGEITITARQFLAGQFQFLKHWIYCLAAIVFGAFRQESAPPSVLVHNIADEHLFPAGTDKQFIAYCRRGPIDPLRAGKRFFIASSSGKISSEPGVFTYCQRPLIGVLLESRLGLFGRLGLLARHLVLLVEFPWRAVRTPSLSLLGREMAYTRIAVALDDHQLIESIVFTCDSWGVQPLWTRSLRHAKVHLIWYSQSPQSASYVFDDEKAVGPPLRWIRVDTHWVWTKALAKYLREHGQVDGDIEVVGPIVWQLPEAGQRDGQALKLLAFDVPAVTDDIMLNVVGEITNYYHPRNLRSFISDIASLKAPLEQALGRPVSYSLKMKRGMRPHYAESYYDFISEMSASGQLLRVNPNDNLYSMISGSDLVIAYPFTSAAYVAEWLGVPAIFYDPTESVVRDDFCESKDSVRFVQGPRDLLSVALALLKQTDRVVSTEKTA
jgi:hypothetical protein